MASTLETVDNDKLIDKATKYVLASASGIENDPWLEFHGMILAAGGIFSMQAKQELGVDNDLANRAACAMRDIALSIWDAIKLRNAVMATRNEQAEPGNEST